MKFLQNILLTLIMFCWFGICYIGCVLVSVSEAYAKDFGIEGHIFSIIEEDFLEVINVRLNKIDWEKFNQKIQNQTKEYVERPTSVSGITKAKEKKEFFYDPTYVLDQDIKDYTGRLIHSAGTVVNPLEFTKLNDALLFIDGDDYFQVNFALEQYKTKNEKLKIILVKGSLLKLQRKEKIWIYFDQGGILTTKLGIKEIPALVEQDGVRLKISIIPTEAKSVGK